MNTPFQCPVCGAELVCTWAQTDTPLWHCPAARAEVELDERGNYSRRPPAPHAETRYYTAAELGGADPPAGLAGEDLAELTDPRCCACNRAGELRSTYCGSFCAECLAEHVAVCEVCAADFGGLPFLPTEYDPRDEV